jgi:hypothetical protein
MIELNYDGPRFLVLHHVLRRPRPTNGYTVTDEPTPGADEDTVHEIHGGRNPTLFQTLKMAHKAARDRYTWVKAPTPGTPRKRPVGRVFLFDVNQLAEVTGDGVFEMPGLADRLTELEFAERQMQLWAERAAALASGKRP